VTSPATVSLGANDYVVYVDQASTQKYLAASLTTAAVLWSAASPTGAQIQSMIMASRMLDRLIWQGVPVNPPVMDSVLQWPRSNVIVNGVPVDPTTIPDDLQRAMMELAAAVLADPTLYTTETSGSNIKEIDAGGGVKVEFFVPTLGDSGRYPIQILELIRDYLSGGADSGTFSGSSASGADGTATSEFGTLPNELGYGLNRGY
jgi:hypothetical protein